MVGLKSLPRGCDHEWSNHAYTLFKTVKSGPRIPLKNIMMPRQTRARQTAAKAFVHTIHTLKCLYSISLIHCSQLMIPLCLHIFLFTLLIMLDNNIMYLRVRSNRCCKPTVDIWPQLCSLEMTSKPYFQRTKTLIFRYSLLAHHFFCVVCSAAKQQ